MSSPDQPPAAKGGQVSTWSMMRTEGPSEGQPKHNPDYNVAVDYRTS